MSKGKFRLDRKQPTPAAIPTPPVAQVAPPPVAMAVSLPPPRRELPPTRTRIKSSNKILAIITVKDKAGRREAVGMRRVPAWADKFAIKKVARAYIVDLEKSFWSLKGMKTLFYDIESPNPITFNELPPDEHLIIAGQIVDSQKLYVLTETKAIEKMITASTKAGGGFEMITWIMLIVGAVMGFFMGAFLGPQVFKTVITPPTNSTATHIAVQYLWSTIAH